MIVSPAWPRFAANRKRAGVATTLIMFIEFRFDPIPDDLVSILRAIDDDATLDRRARLAVRCPDIGAFRAGLPA